METLNWGRLFAWLFGLPKAVLFTIAIAGFFLLMLFEPFLVFLLFGFVFLTGPFRQKLKPKQRREMNAFVVRANKYFEQQQNSR